MAQLSSKDWLEAISNKFDHPAIVLWRAIELKTIDRALNNRKLQEPILDLGCAEGKIGNLLFKGNSVIGLDNCWELLKNNKERDIYRALILADGCSMPYKSAVFASVFSNCVIEHIPDIDSLLSETARVLKDNGMLVFTVPSHKFGEFLFFTTIFENMKLKRLADWYKKKRNKLLNHFHCYDHNQWRVIVEKHGFNLLEYEYYMPKDATFFWDFLAAAVLVIRKAWPLSYFLPNINKWLIKYLKIYYNIDSSIGSGLLLVAQKQAR